jgi:AcrR family transcriptional regulator
MNPVDETVKPGPGNRDARKDRWSEHRAQRRQEFVAAALRVLEGQGPELPMDAVAAEAGVTKPVLYRYFADKAALVQALDEFGSTLLLSRLLPAIDADRPAMARVREAVGAYFSVIEEYPNLHWLLVRQAGGEPGDDPLHRNKQFIATRLTAVIGDYLRSYGLDSGAAEPWGHGLTGLVQNTGEWWLERRSMSRADVTEYLTRLIWAAISGLLSDAGITLDPDQPLPRQPARRDRHARPRLTVHPGQAAAAGPDS